MKDFEGKIIRVIFNSTYGTITETGKYIKNGDSFLVMEAEHTKKIEYISMYAVKTVEIVGDVYGHE